MDQRQISPEILLSVDLTVRYRGGQPALQAVQMDVFRGEILGLAGESGSGKSTLGMALAGLLRSTGANVSGRVEFRGRNLLGLREKELAAIRGSEVTYVMQNAGSALNPKLRLGTQFREAWRAHRAGESWVTPALATMCQLGLPADAQFLRKYPQELSVGMAQRVLLALATLHSPKLLILDEPTSALDLACRADVLRLVRGLNDRGVTIIFISHDHLALAAICDRVSVLARGCLVETLRPEELLNRSSEVLCGRSRGVALV